MRMMPVVLSRVDCDADDMFVGGGIVGGGDANADGPESCARAFIKDLLVAGREAPSRRKGFGIVGAETQG